VDYTVFLTSDHSSVALKGCVW